MRGKYRCGQIDGRYTLYRCGQSYHALAGVIAVDAGLFIILRIRTMPNIYTWLCVMAHSGSNRHMYTSQLMLHCWMNEPAAVQAATHAHAQRQSLTPVPCMSPRTLPQILKVRSPSQSMHYLYEHDRPVSHRPRRLACMHAPVGWHRLQATSIL